MLGREHVAEVPGSDRGYPGAGYRRATDLHWHHPEAANRAIWSSLNDISLISPQTSGLEHQ
jgi:hypothetical protein